MQTDIIIRLRTKVTAAQEEFDFAIALHEVWKPTAYDADLHARMGRSRATNAFLVTRSALRREVLMALMRLWDADTSAIGIEDIAAKLRINGVMDTLAHERARNIGQPDELDGVRATLATQAEEVQSIVAKYAAGGPKNAILTDLRALRDKHLAHRETKPSAPTGPNSTDAEIEEFFQDNLKLVQLLLSLVNAVSYNPEDSAQIHRRYAELFWAPARGEQTEGHPNYRKRPPLTSGNA